MKWPKLPELYVGDVVDVNFASANKTMRGEIIFKAGSFYRVCFEKSGYHMHYEKYPSTKVEIIGGIHVSRMKLVKAREHFDDKLFEI
jgi:hypothetical protein